MTKQKKHYIARLIEKVKGVFRAPYTEGIAEEAYDMGTAYASQHRFQNSSHYHPFRYRLDDGSLISSGEYYRIFTTRMQTPAYIDAEKAVQELLPETASCERDRLFHLVREQRRGINGVFRAVTSPREIQPLAYSDYVLVIACFCIGLIMAQQRSPQHEDC